MKCETCGKEINQDEQMPGQYNEVCFSCWEKGHFETDNKLVWNNWNFLYKNKAGVM